MMSLPAPPPNQTAPPPANIFPPPDNTTSSTQTAPPPRGTHPLECLLVKLSNGYWTRSPHLYASFLLVWKNYRGLSGDFDIVGGQCKVIGTGQLVRFCDDHTAVGKYAIFGKIHMSATAKHKLSGRGEGCSRVQNPINMTE